MTPSLSAAQEENREKLLDAAEKGRADELRSLLNGVDINCRGGHRIPCCGDFNATPLWHAAWNGHTECVRLLIDAGADLNLPNKVRAARRSVDAPVGRAPRHAPSCAASSAATRRSAASARRAASSPPSAPAP